MSRTLKAVGFRDRGTLPDGVYELHDLPDGMCVIGAQRPFGPDPVVVVARVRQLRGKACELLFKLSEKNAYFLPLRLGQWGQGCKKFCRLLGFRLAHIRRERSHRRVYDLAERLGLERGKVSGRSFRRLYCQGGDMVCEDGKQYALRGRSVVHLDEFVSHCPPSPCEIAASGIKPPNGTTVEKNDGGGGMITHTPDREAAE